MTKAPSVTTLDQLWLSDRVIHEVCNEAGISRASATWAVHCIRRKARYYPFNAPIEMRRARFQEGSDHAELNAADFVAIMGLDAEQFKRARPNQYGPKIHAAGVALAEALKRKYPSLEV